MPVLAVIAGPNGSGKTTFSNLWRHCLSYPLHNFPVSDPDAVMAVLTPNDPVAAGRLTPTDRQHMLKSDRAWVVDNSGHQFALGARSDGKNVKVLEGAPAWIRDLLRSIPDNAMRQAQ